MNEQNLKIESILIIFVRNTGTRDFVVVENIFIQVTIKIKLPILEYISNKTFSVLTFIIRNHVLVSKIQSRPVVLRKPERIHHYRNGNTYSMYSHFVLEKLLKMYDTFLVIFQVQNIITVFNVIWEIIPQIWTPRGQGFPESTLRLLELFISTLSSGL